MIFSGDDKKRDMKHNKIFSANFLSRKRRVKIVKWEKNAFSIFDCEYYYITKEGMKKKTELLMIMKNCMWKPSL